MGFVSGVGGTHTQHNDAARTGTNPREISLLPSNVRRGSSGPDTLGPAMIDPATIDPATIGRGTINPGAIGPIDPGAVGPGAIDPDTIGPGTTDRDTTSRGTFGKLFTRSLDGNVYAQPLYVANVPIRGQGHHNVVFVATAHNTVYAYDADTPAATAPLWSINLGPSVPALNTPNDPIETGISATPVIDATTDPTTGDTTGTLYVSAKTLEDGVQIWRLHALDITSGAHVHQSPVKITATTAGTGDAPVSFRADRHDNRSGLLLLNETVYLAFAAHNAHDPHHGWIIGYSAANLQAPPAVFNTTPDGSAGGIWQGGQGLTADADGNIYCMVGHGSSEAVNGGKNYGEAFVKLSTKGGGLAVADWFIPHNYSDLHTDGASGPLGIPGTTYLVGGNKSGTLYVLDTDQMGGFNQGADSQIVQSFNAWTGEYRGAPLYWNSARHGPVIYVWGSKDVGKAYSFTGAAVNETPIMHTPDVPSVANFATSPAMSISANGGADGILWAVMATPGPPNSTFIDATAPTGVLRAFDANDLSVELWNSDQIPPPTDLATDPNSARQPSPTAGSTWPRSLGNCVSTG